MGKQKPLRMCVVCREQKEKNELIRVVKNKDGEIFVDESFKANGRGAYVCKSGDCIEKCIKTRALNRALKCEIPQELLEEIKKI